MQPLSAQLHSQRPAPPSRNRSRTLPILSGAHTQKGNRQRKAEV